VFLKKLVFLVGGGGGEVRKTLEKHQKQTALKLCEVIVSPVFFMRRMETAEMPIKRHSYNISKERRNCESCI